MTDDVSLCFFFYGGMQEAWRTILQALKKIQESLAFCKQNIVQYLMELMQF